MFKTLIYQPLLNILICLYNLIPGGDFGVAVIVMTGLIRLALYPLNSKAIKAQVALNEVQPKIKEIQKKYANNKEEQGKQMMEVYRQAKISPFSGIGPILIQLPILLALYQIFYKGFSSEILEMVYEFISKPETINPVFLGLVNLSTPLPLMAVIAGLMQFLQGETLQPKKMEISSSDDPSAKMASAMQKQMKFTLPIFTALILLKTPAVVSLYWITSSVFSIIQQLLVNRKKHDVERKNKDN